MTKNTKEALKRKKKALRNKEKALKRAGAMIKATGDEVFGLASNVEEALKDAEARGRDQAYQHCRNIVDEARTIGAARQKIRDVMGGISEEG